MANPTATHPEYDKYKSRWKRCRDIMDGQDAIHDGGREYLPELKDQTPAEYSAYVMRTPFYNATQRTADGLIGMVFRKAPVLEAPTALVDMAVDITLTGITLDGLAEQVEREVIEVGRCGVLVEYPRVEQTPANAAQAAAMNLRPYATLYKTESIINWRIERVNNKMQPTLVVLAESVEEPVNEFEANEVAQYRVLMLVEGVYTQRVYRQAENGTLEIVDEVIPTINGSAIVEIPFYPFGPQELTMRVQDSPLMDLVDLNLSHYRTSADLEHGAHFAGLPTAVVSGYTAGEHEKLYIGSATAWVFPDPQATASYLEFTGQGLGALEKLLDRKEAQMAAIGARMLAPEKKQAEAAATVELRHSGEASVLAAMTQTISTGMTEVLRFMARWAGIAGEVKYTMNTDYFPARMSAQDLTALVTAWQQGGISWNTLFANLKQGEVIKSDVTEEEEQARLETRAPTLE